MIAFSLFSLLLPALVSAHGYVNSVTIDGTVYQGNPVGTTATMSSAIRQVNSNSPVKNSTNPDLNCGTGAQLAASMANANPGSQVDILWVGGTNGVSPWPHNTGPIMTYMAQCQGSCTTWDSSSAEWFKISELGLMSDNKTWYQSQVQSGQPVSVSIPSTLAPGNYLMRTEIISLQLAMTLGGAEFYPACIQLTVGGSQTGQPTANEEVTFPGGYSDTDPGILVPNVYNPGFVYVFPGPPVVNLGSAGSAPSGSGSSSSSPVAPSSPPATSSAPSVASPSAPATTSVPANVGGAPPSSASATPSATTTGKSSSTCPSKRSKTPQSSSSSLKARMHRRRLPTSH